MLRLVLWNLFLFGLPFTVALLWLKWIKRVPFAQAGYKIWAGAALAGLALLFTSLLLFRSSLGVPPGGSYIPPHMENGQLMPRQFETK